MNPEDRVDEHLMHYGVLGMKWGKRKARTSKIKISEQTLEQTLEQALDQALGQAPKKRRMSNKELQARIKRLKMEKEYAQLTASPPKTSRVEKLVKGAGTVAALSASAVTIYQNMDKIAKIYKVAKKASGK